MPGHGSSALMSLALSSKQGKKAATDLSKHDVISSLAVELFAMLHEVLCLNLYLGIIFGFFPSLLALIIFSRKLYVLIFFSKFHQGH